MNNHEPKTTLEPAQKPRTNWRDIRVHTPQKMSAYIGPEELMKRLNQNESQTIEPSDGLVPK